MNKNKIAIGAIVIIIALIAVISIVFWPKDGVSNSNNSEIILYYSNTCSHCKIVEDFIDQNSIAQKISFQSKEVSENQANSIELATKAQKCSISTDSIGVPFLWDGSNSKCIIGDTDIIQFFKDKTGIK